MSILSLKLTAKDGAEIQAEFRKDEIQPVKGIVIVVHGFGEHIGNYKDLALVLANAGFASITFNQRGHGDFSAFESPEKHKGVIPGYQTFMDDIEIIVAEAKRLEHDVPIAIYGHSMGGNIAMNYLLRNNQADFSCAILESPWFKLHNDLGGFGVFLGRLLGKLSKKLAIYNKLDPNNITGDADIAATYGEDPLYHNRISFRLFIGVRDAGVYALENASKLNIPIYLASGVNDKIVSNEAIAMMGEAIGENVTMKEYDSYHAIRNDLLREEFYSEVIAFLASHM